jgi:methyl-accepting chemotaxis protein
MKNWTIAQRIAIGGGSILALLIAVSLTAVVALRSLGRGIDAIRTQYMPGVSDAGLINHYLADNYVCILLAGNAATPEKREGLLGALDEMTARSSEASERYERTITSEEDRRNFAELIRRRTIYRKAREEYVALIRADKRAEASELRHTQLEPAYTAYTNQGTVLLEWNVKQGNAESASMSATASRAIRLAIVIASVSIALGAIVGWIIIRTVGRILRAMSRQLDDGAEQVAAAAGQVSASSQSLAQGASEQAASLEETGSSLEELSSMTRRNADSAASAKTLSGETRAAAETGNNDMAEMRRAMDAIKSSSSDIAKIIKSIDEIAFQTNILALNAAVEAARAGEAGMGFAVVAEEVRALAQRSANSARETADKIDVAIRNGEQGVTISEKVAESLGIIVEKARKVDQLVGEITTASNEQSQGIGQINGAVSQMDKVTQNNASSAEETAAAAEELNAQATMMKESVASLRLLVDGGRAEPRMAAPSAPPPSRAPQPPPTPRVGTRTVSERSARNRQGAAQDEAFFRSA